MSDNFAFNNHSYRGSWNDAISKILFNAPERNEIHYLCLREFQRQRLRSADSQIVHLHICMRQKKIVNKGKV